MNAAINAPTSSQTRQRRWDLIKKWIGRIPSYVVLGAWSFFTLFVILWIIVNSLKSNQELFKDVWALPTQLHFENYVKALTTPPSRGSSPRALLPAPRCVAEAS